MIAARVALAGRVGSPGVGKGRVLLVAPIEDPGTRGPVGSVEEERSRLQTALETAAADLEALARQLAERAGDETGAIFEAQALFARDPGIVDPALRLIDDGSGAIDAILASTDDQAAVLAGVDDEYFRARAADVRDVGRRVASILSGQGASDLWHADGHPAILVAQDLDPSAVATLRPGLVAGIALGDGAPTGHVSIVARGLGIPLVLGLGPDIASIRVDAEAIVDARDQRVGSLVIDPDAHDLSALAQTVASVGRAPTATAAHQGEALVEIHANVGSVIEAEAAMRAGATGIGLVRTELLFLGRRTPPSVAEQRNLYGRIRVAMAGRPVVFRTLDVGGDKPAAWQTDRPEANPALGVRGVRLGLARPSVLDDQLQALLESAAGDEVRIMLPMISSVEEVVAVRTRLDAIVATVDRPPSLVRLGVMIEVPSAAILADGLAEVADFFSIGTNDLVQYTLAADRVNPALAELATPLQPAVLRLIARVVSAAQVRGLHVSVCGEAAADPEVMPLLVGMGVDSLSVAPNAVEVVRANVAGLSLDACRHAARLALAATTVDKVREAARSAAR